MQHNDQGALLKLDVDVKFGSKIEYKKTLIFDIFSFLSSHLHLKYVLVSNLNPKRLGLNLDML